MADISPSALHDIGNVLNNINTSLQLVSNKVDKQLLARLQIVIDSMSAHQNELNDYLSQDEKGKLLPEYLIVVVRKLMQQYQQMESEIETLGAHLQHIEEIVLREQLLSQSVHWSQKVALSDMIDSALKISGCDREKIIIQKDYQVAPTMMIDKTKVIAILVNLFNNAQQAMQSSAIQQNRVMNIIVEKIDSDDIRILVSDNGPGISDENRVKLFSLNFTTKFDGHGIGLYASANLAEELGGKLQLEQSVPGQGATFSLRLPLEHTCIKEERL